MIPEPRLAGLYQEVILDHNRRPRNFKKIENPGFYSHGYNPLCGDDYHLYVNLENGVIRDVGFEGAGCAISKSSASIMTTLVKDKALEEVKKLRDDFLAMMTRDPVPEGVLARVGRLKLFEGVKEFPIRVKCATLIWQALGDILKDAALQA